MGLQKLISWTQTTQEGEADQSDNLSDFQKQNIIVDDQKKLTYFPNKPSKERDKL